MEKVKELNDREIYLKDIAEKLNVNSSMITRVVNGERNTQWIKDSIDKTLSEARRVCTMAKYKVYDGEYQIDTFYFRKKMTAKEVKKVLVEEEGFDEDITVKKFKL